MPQDIFEVSFLVLCAIVLWTSLTLSKLVTKLAQDRLNPAVGFEVQRVPAVSVKLPGRGATIPLLQLTAIPDATTGFLFVRPERYPLGLWRWAFAGCQQYSTHDVHVVCQGSESACSDMVRREFITKEPPLIVDTDGKVAKAFGAQPGFAIFLDAKQRVVRKGILHLNA